MQVNPPPNNSVQAVDRQASFNPCIVIPCYNHGGTMAAVLDSLKTFKLHCFIVNDGSSEPTKTQLTELASCHDWVTLINLPENKGKGEAVLTGLKTAWLQGFTHGLQVDADGQHNFTDIPLLLAKAQQCPTALISGSPVYDESVPKSRLYARYITHVWVWIETLSTKLKDSMCGFRVYPIEPTLILANKHSLGKRMDFDTEIMVRLYWMGVDVHFIPTKVIYPEQGISHFRLWRDNLRISWMHTRLFLAMLPKIPSLIKRNLQKEQHWSDISERKGLAGIRFMVKMYRLFGRKAFSFLLYPVAGYFWLTGKTQRQASEQYIKQIKQYAQQKNIDLPTNLNSYRHFWRFGEAMLDKLAGWLGDIKITDINFADKTACLGQLATGRGTLILGSHLGDMELCRALGQLSYNVTINALVFTQHAMRFHQVMQEFAPDATINMIQVDKIGPDTAILLQQKLDAGEWVAIVGDRTPVSAYHRNQHVVWADFLGKPAPFPGGPFALASALRCPVCLMFGIKPDGQFHVYFETFADPLVLPRATRQQALQEIVQRYAQRLETYCLKSPLDWFNFFDFWQLHTKNHSSQEGQHNDGN